MIIISYVVGIIVCLALSYAHSYRSIKFGARSRHNHIAIISLSSLSWTGVVLLVLGWFILRFVPAPK